jgi:hypothetical protein
LEQGYASFSIISYQQITETPKHHQSAFWNNLARVWGSTQEGGVSVGDNSHYGVTGAMR